jgi:hypothetical protein
VRRACVLALALSLLAAATASAKGGVIFERYPDVQALGSRMKFTTMVMREGIRPLVTFTDRATGDVVRVRGSRSDLTIGGRPYLPGDSEPFHVGVGLTQTIPSADAERRAAPASVASAGGDGSAAWPWIAAAGAALTFASALVLIRRRPRGAA